MLNVALNVVKSSTTPDATTFNESAVNLFYRGDYIEAARQLQWALVLDPEYDEAWHNRAMILNALRDPFDAILCCDKAIEINPYNAIYHNTRGVCLSALGLFADAMVSYEESLLHNPDLSSAWHNRGYVAKLLNRMEDAVTYHRMATHKHPGNPTYHMALAAALLAVGELEDGWLEYEYRFKVLNSNHRQIPLPKWRGHDIKGLILCAEQGYGDTIQFLRYGPILKQLYPNMQVYVEVKKPLLQLARTMEGIDGVVLYGDPLPSDATHYLPMMSAPIYAGTHTIDDIPSESYLRVRDSGKPAIQVGKRSYNVGICWSAGTRPNQPELQDIAERKSIALRFLQPLADIENVRWFNLQVPSPAEKPFPMEDYEIHDFYDTACLISSLDLVVTVDTSVAHLAGAIGANTILMTPRDNCWRWFDDRLASPWYPSLRQYRQPVSGDWASVIAKVKELITVMARPNQVAAE